MEQRSDPTTAERLRDTVRRIYKNGEYVIPCSGSLLFSIDDSLDRLERLERENAEMRAAVKTQSDLCWKCAAEHEIATHAATPLTVADVKERIAKLASPYVNADEQLTVGYVAGAEYIVQKLTEQLAAETARADAAVAWLRAFDWCAGCKNMKHRQCKLMEKCGKEKDLYDLCVDRGTVEDEEV